jgi:oxygen-independent coproporphyrinogen III oxidase
MTESPSFDTDLIRRYDRAGPRYTSYPTAVQFNPDYGLAQYQADAQASNEDPIPRPLSLYVHVPFCSSPCFYCGCMKVVTRQHEKAEAYLYRLTREVELQGALFDRDREVEQLHFGGGTPTYLTHAELAHLFDKLGQNFGLSSSPTREYAIELDPRTVDRERLRQLAALGFNRASLGIQDFDPEVQVAVNRVQSEPETLALIDDARGFGFESISVDLIYGLPKQTVERFAHTLDTVLTARPDRFAVYGYAHLPQMFKPQRQINEEDLPSAETRLQLLALTVEKLSSAGYVYIGMDHFALPGDELVRAQQTGHLHRNFQGYSTRGYLDLVALGVSAIGKIGDSYAQNAKTLGEYYACLDRHELSVHRGLRLSADDRIRRDVIQQLMCYGTLDFAGTGARFGVDFREYFGAELRALEPLVADGLAEWAGPGLKATPAGRFLLRHLAMVFDAHLPAAQATQQRFSKVI